MRDLSIQNYSYLLTATGIVMFFIFSFNYHKNLAKMPNYYLYIYIAMFPYTPRFISPAFDILMKLILLTGLTIMIISKEKYRINKWELLLLVVVIITAILNYESISIGLFQTNFINLLFMVVFSFLSLNSIDKREQLIEIFKTFTINGIIISLLAFVEYIIVGVARPKVLLGNPNYLGFYLCFSLIMFLYIDKIWSLKGTLYILLISIALVLTDSSTIVLIVLCTTIFNIVLLFKVKFLKKLFWLFFLFIGVFYMYLIIAKTSTNLGLLNLFVKDDYSRVTIWSYTWKVFTENIITGIGYGNMLAPYSGREYVTHNDYLRLLSEVGLLGFLLMALYINKIYKLILRYEFKETLLLSSILFTILIFSLTHNNMNSILFWWGLSLPLYIQGLKRTHAYGKE